MRTQRRSGHKFFTVLRWGSAIRRIIATIPIGTSRQRYALSLDGDPRVGNAFVRKMAPTPALYSRIQNIRVPPSRDWEQVHSLGRNGSFSHGPLPTNYDPWPLVLGLHFWSTFAPGPRMDQ
jgi:hypothetical protein